MNTYQVERLKMFEDWVEWAVDKQEQKPFLAFATSILSDPIEADYYTAAGWDKLVWRYRNELHNNNRR